MRVGSGRRDFALVLAALAGLKTPEMEREVRIRNLANSPPFVPLPPKIPERRAKGHDVIPAKLYRKSRRGR